MVDTDRLDIERRARRAVVQDGLADLFFGVALLACAGWLYLSLLGGLGRPYAGWMIAVAALFGLEWTRRKVTYPRVGYVKFRKAGPVIVVMVLLALLTFGGVVVALLTKERGFRMPAGFWQYFVMAVALVGAGLVAWNAHRLDTSRFYVYAALAVLGMLLPWLLRLDFEYRAIGLMGLPGLVMVPWGAVTLVRFLRTHPKQTEADGGHE